MRPFTAFALLLLGAGLGRALMLYLRYVLTD
jgi:hypothetical protein